MNLSKDTNISSVLCRQSVYLSTCATVHWLAQICILFATYLFGLLVELLLFVKLRFHNLAVSLQLNQTILIFAVEQVEFAFQFVFVLFQELRAAIR